MPHWSVEEDTDAKLPSLTMLRRLYPFVRPHLPKFAIAFLLGMISVWLILRQPIVLKQIIDVDFMSGDREGLFAHGALYFGLLLSSSVASAVASILLGRSGVLAVNAIKRQLFGHFLSLGLPWVEQHPIGKLVSRIESDSGRLVNLCSTLAMRMLSPVVMIVGAAIYILLADVRLALVALVFLPLMVIGTWLMFSKMRPAFREERRLYGELTGTVGELVPALRLLQALGRGDWARARLAAAGQVYRQYTTRLFFFEYGFWSGIGFIEILLTCAGLGLGVRWVEDGSMTVGTLVMFAQYAAMIYWPVLALSEQLAEIQRAGGAADRVFGGLDVEPTIRAPESPKSVPEHQPIRFDHVTFGYDPDQPVLHDVSFEVATGTTTALIGATGSGKSTIINLLMRFRDVGGGAIRLGETDIRELDPHDYRRHFGLVLQDLYLFPAPIRDNLSAFRPGIDDSRLEEAMQQAGIADLIASRGGLDGTLTEGGADLSYGERQLLAFARALAIDPEFLVLDEATSSVDPGTELRIQRALESLTQHRTSIIVAHRLSTIRHADQILLLDEGRIIERGTHAQLIARSGRYAALVRLQELGWDDASRHELDGAAS